MITIKKLIELLGIYDENSEVILPDGSEIKHIGMCFIPNSRYKVILANDKKDLDKF